MVYIGFLFLLFVNHKVRMEGLHNTELKRREDEQHDKRLNVDRIDSRKLKKGINPFGRVRVRAFEEMKAEVFASIGMRKPYNPGDIQFATYFAERS